jgi:hypothetical protein
MKERDRFCQRCKCCSTDWEDCYNCVDGYSDHDCGDDTCCCLNPKDNVRCDICDGEGGWVVCIGGCDEQGNHSREAASSGSPNATPVGGNIECEKE